MNDKLRAARLSIASNTALTLSKLVVGLLMNSVSVLSEGIHSGLDLIAALIAFFSVRESSKPADECHPFGHGKFENVASILEALLILGAAAMIIANAYPKLRGAVEINSLGLGATVMGVSALVNYFVSRELMRVARKTESPALAADACMAPAKRRLYVAGRSCRNYCNQVNRPDNSRSDHCYRCNLFDRSGWSKTHYRLHAQYS